MQGWKLHVHEEGLWDLYRSRASALKLLQRPEDLVVLTPDAEEELDVIEEAKIYVVGGLVDRRPQKKRRCSDS